MTEKELKENVYPHRELMYRIAYALTRDADDASEAVQQVIIAVWENGRKSGLGSGSREISNWRSYCIKSVRHKALTIIERRERNVAIEFDREAPDDPEAYESVQTRDMIEELIDTLPDRQREIIRMSAIGGLDNREIAEATGLEENNIRQALSRGRNKLKTLLAKHL